MIFGPCAGSEGTAANAHFYVYDAWNRLTQVWQDVDGDGQLETGEDEDYYTAQYAYDGLNRRIKWTHSPKESTYTYDYYYNENWQVLEVRKDGDTDPYKQYIWDPRYIDAPAVRFRDGNTDGDLGDSEDDTLYYLTDANFNVTALADTDGDIVERYEYDAYGKATVLHGDDDADGEVTEWDVDSGGSDWDNQILYCGYRFDKTTKLYHVRNRQYHPTLGRWMQRDPGASYTLADDVAAFDDLPLAQGDGLGSVTAPDPWSQYQDGMSLYQYVLGDPVSHSDPTGLVLRPTKYWHARGKGATKIKAGLFIEVEHSVISEDQSQTKGVDFAPEPKKSNDKGKKKVSGLAWLLWGATGHTTPWKIQIPLDYSKASQYHRLCITDDEHRWIQQHQIKGRQPACRCACEDDVKACIRAVAGEWNGTTWKRGHDCRHFVSEAEWHCCLVPCPWPWL